MQTESEPSMTKRDALDLATVLAQRIVELEQKHADLAATVERVATYLGVLHILHEKSY